MLAPWLLSMVVLVNAFFGVFTSLMAVPMLEPTVDTLDEVVANGQFKVTMEKGTTLASTFLVRDIY